MKVAIRFLIITEVWNPWSLISMFSASLQGCLCTRATLLKHFVINCFYLNIPLKAANGILMNDDNREGSRWRSSCEEECVILNTFGLTVNKEKCATYFGKFFEVLKKQNNIRFHIVSTKVHRESHEVSGAVRCFVLSLSMDNGSLYIVDIIKAN